MLFGNPFCIFLFEEVKETSNLTEKKRDLSVVRTEDLFKFFYISNGTFTLIGSSLFLLWLVTHSWKVYYPSPKFIQGHPRNLHEHLMTDT